MGSRHLTSLYQSMGRFALGAVDKPWKRKAATTDDTWADVLESVAMRRLMTSFARCGFVVRNTGATNTLSYRVRGRLADEPGALITLIEATDVAPGANSGVVAVTPFARDILIEVTATTAAAYTTYEAQVVWLPL